MQPNLKIHPQKEKPVVPEEKHYIEVYVWKEPTGLYKDSWSPEMHYFYSYDLEVIWWIYADEFHELLRDLAKGDSVE